MAKSKSVGRKAVKRTSGVDESIEDRLAGAGRGDASCIIHLRDTVERTLKGEFGAILKALTVGRTSRELAENRDGKLSSDRVLGRIEMAEILWNDLEQYVIDGDALMVPTNSETDLVSYNYSPE